jgi:hypothetical protein
MIFTHESTDFLCLKNYLVFVSHENIILVRGERKAIAHPPIKVK